MSRHDGVSCDACSEENFKGRRYKCLICYDYDLCASCYENGSTTNHHTTSHAMQCILTRQDFDIFHGGEALTPDQPQSLTCPFCGKMGFTERTLQEHVTANHLDTASEVVCPICASFPGGEPNHLTDEFAAHLTLDHPSGAPRELDVAEPTSRHGVRRMQHQGRGLSRGVSRQNMRFGSINSGLLTSSSRSDSMDPIAELLSQLSGVRRATASDLLSSADSHLEQSNTRQQQIDRLPTRRSGVTSSGLPTSSNNVQTHTASNLPNGNGGIISGLSNNVTSSAPIVVENVQAGVVASLSANATSSIATAHQQSVPSGGKQQAQSQFLLARLNEAEGKKEELKSRDRASFVQELLISTLCDLSLDAEECTSSNLPLPPPLLETTPLTYDVATQTSHSMPSTPTSNVLNTVPPPLGFTSPPPLLPSKTTTTSSVQSTLKGSSKSSQTKLVTRSSPGNVALPTPLGGLGRPCDAGGPVSPTSGRRKPVRGGSCVGGRSTQSQQPH